MGRKTGTHRKGRQVSYYRAAMNRLAKGGLNAFEGGEGYPAVVVAYLDVSVAGSVGL